jgi:quinol monooxygenase YgiN
MHTPAVVLTIRLAVRDDIRRELGALLGEVSTTPGCQRVALAQEAGAAGRVMLVEEWTTREELERHLRSDAFWRLLLLSEASIEPPEFSIDTVTAREGLDAIARARAAGSHPGRDDTTLHQGR